MGSPETEVARADGGEQADWRQPLLALLFAFMGATAGSGIAERWSVPGFFIGLAIFLWFFAETE